MAKALDAMPGFTFGCDPELFIFDTNDRPVSADGIIPGTKAEPYKVMGGAVQVDGLAAEFNIDPVSSYEEFRHNIAIVMTQLSAYLPAGYKLRAVPSVVFDKKVFDDSRPECLELGCQPDFNAWDNRVNPPPEPKDNPFLRTASGHLHIGWTDDEDVTSENHAGNCIDLVRQLDWYLGGWSVEHDPDPTRRTLYGRAGACRFKPYGVEYRVLSNFWVTSNSLRLAVWNRMQQAIYDMRDCFVPERTSGRNNVELIDKINKSKLRVSPGFDGMFAYPLQTLATSYRRI